MVYSLGAFPKKGRYLECRKITGTKSLRKITFFLEMRPIEKSLLVSITKRLFLCRKQHAIDFAQNHTIISTEVLKPLPFSTIAKLPNQMITQNEILPNKETLYLDSSVPSAYFDERVLWRMKETQEWWHNELPQYESFISSVVILEINNTRNEKRREQLLNLVAHFPQSALLTEIEQIAKGYLSQKIIPQSSSPDALHIAIASFYKIDFLVTWNCKHLAEGHRRKQIKLFNTSAGLYVPEIVTPIELKLNKGDEKDVI